MMVEVPMRKMYAELLAEKVPFNVGVQLAGRPYSEELVLRVCDSVLSHFRKLSKDSYSVHPTDLW